MIKTNDDPKKKLMKMILSRLVQLKMSQSKYKRRPTCFVFSLQKNVCKNDQKLTLKCPN